MKKEFQKIVEKHRGEIVIEFFKLARLEGFAENEDDYYYVLRSLGEPNVYWASCVGNLMFLKDSLSEKEYGCLERIFNLNTK